MEKIRKRLCADILVIGIMSVFLAYGMNAAVEAEAHAEYVPKQKRYVLWEVQETDAPEQKEYILREVQETDAPKTDAVQGTVEAETSPEPFACYDVASSEIERIARLCYQEQCTAEGAAAEASLLLNRFERYGSGFASPSEYAEKSGWFFEAQHFMDDAPDVSSDVYEEVESVIRYGLRRFPTSVDEHDCLRDIERVSNNGTEFDKNDKSMYISGVTVIDNKLGSTYTFYSFPAEGSDPFGCIS